MNSTICNISSPRAVYTPSAPIIPSIYLQSTATVVYTFLSLFTVGGNALVCLVVFHYMGTTTVTNLFIANLAVTDLFIGLFCIPIVLISDYLLSGWPFGMFMCKLTSFAQSVFVVCTVYTLIAMSVDRYIALIHPLHPKLTRRQCQISIAALWIFSVLFSSPIFYEMHIVEKCFSRDSIEQSQTVCETNGLPGSLQTIYNMMTLTIIYIAPLCVLSTMYIRLGCYLNRSRLPGEAHSERDAKMKKSKKKVIKMCFIIVITFGVCWCPMQIYINILRRYLDQVFDEKYVPHFYFAFHLMAMSNSCVNPFIYGVMSSKFRAGYFHYCRSFFTCCKAVNDPSRGEELLNESVLLTASFRPVNRSFDISCHHDLKDIERRRSTPTPLRKHQRTIEYVL